VTAIVLPGCDVSPYRAAIAVLDQPMTPMTVRSGTPSSSSTVAAVCRAFRFARELSRRRGDH
jgi:hypothetical protein